MHSTSNIIPGVRKIAVLRANAIGDYIYAIPALDALRATYPRAEIVLMGRSWHAQFLSGRPGPIDRVEITPLSKGVNDPGWTEGEQWEDDPAELERFFERAQQEKYDLAIQLHGGGRYSNPFLLRLGARCTAGMRTSDAPPLDRWVPYPYWQNEVMRLLECVALVGAKTVTARPHLAIIPADREEIDAVLPDRSMRLAVIHAGATDFRRRWRAQNFARIIDWLANAGYSVVLVGASSERNVNEEIARQIGARTINFAGRISLNALAGLLERASVLVGNDSGPIHLAEAIGTPSVGIYWAGNMINYGPPSTALHRQVLSWQMTCPVCGSHMLAAACSHQTSFVDDVTVEQVIDEIRDVLAYAQQVAV